MFNWLKKYKGYLLHGLAVAAVVASPGVQAILTAHPGAAALGGLAWGWILHWAKGR
jgi:hypothetical protein